MALVGIYCSDKRGPLGRGIAPFNQNSMK